MLIIKKNTYICSTVNKLSNIKQLLMLPFILVVLFLFSCQKGGEPTPIDVNESSIEVNIPSSSSSFARTGGVDEGSDGGEGEGSGGSDDDGSDDGGDDIIGGDDNEDDDDIIGGDDNEDDDDILGGGSGLGGQGEPEVKGLGKSEL